MQQEAQHTLCLVWFHAGIITEKDLPELLYEIFGDLRAGWSLRMFWIHFGCLGSVSAADDVLLGQHFGNCKILLVWGGKARVGIGLSVGGA